LGLGRGDSPANSLPDAVAEEMFSLPAERALLRKRLIALVIIDEPEPISALK
jgi:hypothetical protein